MLVNLMSQKVHNNEVYFLFCVDTDMAQVFATISSVRQGQSK